MTTMNKYFSLTVLLPIMCLLNACSIFSVIHHPVIPYSSASNPFAQLADVSQARCYGDSRTGVVNFVFNITSRTNIISGGGFGTSFKSKFIARGKAYKPYSSSYHQVELIQGITSECTIPDIRNVRNTVTVFDRIELDWYFNSEHHSGNYKKTLNFYNIPVIWQ